jgi:hypothetical protein
MHNFEQLGAAQQQPDGQPQEQQQEEQKQQQQPPSPTIPQTNGQCDSTGGCATGIPQVDGSADSIDSPSNSQVGPGMAHALVWVCCCCYTPSRLQRLLLVGLARASDRPACAMLRAGAALPDIAPAAAAVPVPVPAAVPIPAAATEEGQQRTTTPRAATVWRTDLPIALATWQATAPDRTQRSR